MTREEQIKLLDEADEMRKRLRSFRNDLFAIFCTAISILAILPPLYKLIEHLWQSDKEFLVICLVIVSSLVLYKLYRPALRLLKLA